MQLSIVVPVYNVAQYLSKCLDSLISQDIDKEDYEIIVVNDGSTDNSGTVALDYANRYPNITLINQENQGLSGARNTGIKAAQGKYIQFVDSDDFLEPNVEKALVDKMEYDNLDILRFNYQNVNERYEVFEPNKSGKPFMDYTDSICNGATFLTERLGYACYVVQFILRTDLVKSQALFKQGVYFEDTEWTPRMLLAAQRVTSTDTTVYNYLVREGSITKGIDIGKKRKAVEDKMTLIESLKQQMERTRDKKWYEGMISSTVISVLNSIVEDFFCYRRQYIKRLRKMAIFPLSDYHLNVRALRKLRVINVSPFLFCWIYRFINK